MKKGERFRVFSFLVVREKAVKLNKNILSYQHFRIVFLLLPAFLYRKSKVLRFHRQAV